MLSIVGKIVFYFRPYDHCSNLPTIPRFLSWLHATVCSLPQYGFSFCSRSLVYTHTNLVTCPPISYSMIVWYETLWSLPEDMDLNADHSRLWVGKYYLLIVTNYYKYLLIGGEIKQTMGWGHSHLVLEY